MFPWDTQKQCELPKKSEKQQNTEGLQDSPCKTLLCLAFQYTKVDHKPRYERISVLCADNFHSAEIVREMSAAGRGPGEDYINRETKYPAVTLRSYIIKCHMVSCKNTRILSEGSSGILNWFLSYHIFAHLYIISCHHNMLQKLLLPVLWLSDIPIFFVFPSWHKIAYFPHRKPMLLVQKCWLPWSSWTQISI